MTAVTRDEFETVRELLASAARYAESAHRGLDQLELAQQRTQLQLDQSGVRIDQLTAAQDRTQQQLDQLTVKVDQLTSDVSGLAHQLEGQAQQAEQDRNQAAIDRAEFRSTVTSLLEVLTQRFNGNGRDRE